VTRRSLFARPAGRACRWVSSSSRSNKELWPPFERRRYSKT